MVNPNSPQRIGMSNLTPNITVPEWLDSLGHDADYQKVLVETGNYLDNPLGLITDDPQGASDKRFVRQNNFIIAYLMHLHKKLDLIATHVKLNTDTLVAQQAILKSTSELLLRQHEVVENMLGLQAQQYQNSLNELASNLQRIVQVSSSQPPTTSTNPPTAVSKRPLRSTQFIWK